MGFFGQQVWALDPKIIRQSNASSKSQTARRGGHPRGSRSIADGRVLTYAGGARSGGCCLVEGGQSKPLHLLPRHGDHAVHVGPLRASGRGSGSPHTFLVSFPLPTGKPYLLSPLLALWVTRSLSQPCPPMALTR